MPFKKLIFIGMYLCMGSNVAHAYTFYEAVQQTLATHPQIRGAETLQAAAKKDIRQQQGAYLPTFDISYGNGYENSDNPATRADSLAPDGTLINGGDISLNRQESLFLLRQLLFDGGNVANRVAKSKADYQTSTYQFYAVQELLGFAAAQSYLALMRDRELAKILQLDVRAHESMYRKINKRVEAGAGRKSELELAQSRLSLSKANYELAIGRVYTSEATFIKVVGVPPPEHLDMPPTPRNVPRSLNEAQRLAMNLNPTLSAEQALVSSNAAAVGVAKSAYFPTVTLDVSASYNDSLAGVPGYNNTKQALLRLNYNVFRGGRDNAAVAAARYREIAASEDAQKTQRDILESVAFAWESMHTAIRQIPALQTHTTQSYNVWQAYIQQFQLGQQTLFDLMNAQSEYYDAMGALVDAQYEMRIQRYNLLAAMGVFVSTVNNPRFSQLPPEKPSYNALAIAQKVDFNAPATPAATPATAPAASITNAWSYPATNTLPANTNNSGVVTPANTPLVLTPLSSPAPRSSVNKPSAVSVPSNSIINPLNRPALPSTPASPATPRSNVIAPISPAQSGSYVINPLQSPSSAVDKPKLTSNKTVAAVGIKKPATSVAVIVVRPYHLQLLASSNRGNIEQYIKKNNLTANATIHQRTKQGKLIYILTYGSYASSAEAKRAIVKLPKVLQDAAPFVTTT